MKVRCFEHDDRCFLPNVSYIPLSARLSMVRNGNEWPIFRSMFSQDLHSVFRILTWRSSRNLSKFRCTLARPVPRTTTQFSSRALHASCRKEVTASFPRWKLVLRKFKWRTSEPANRRDGTVVSAILPLGKIQTTVSKIRTVPAFKLSNQAPNFETKNFLPRLQTCNTN